MKTIHLTLLLLLLVTFKGHSQRQLQAEGKFHEASNLFINKDYQSALATVNEGLDIQPGNTKLQTLKKILEQEQKKQQQQQEQDKQRENKDQQNQDQNNQQEQNDQKDDKNKDNKENKDGGNQDKEKENEKKEGQQDQKDKQDAQKKEQQQSQSEKGNEDEEKKEQRNSESDKKEQDAGKPAPGKEEVMTISPDKAEMILDAMRTQEKQYLQQLKRKPQRTRESGKPDW